MIKKYYIETYGCQMNIAESEALKNSLNVSGWNETTVDTEAGLIILNTCSVRKTAENRIFGRLGYFKRLKQDCDFKLIIIGCMAERLKDHLIKDYPIVDAVISNFKKDQISKALESGNFEEISAEKNSIEDSYTFFEKHGPVSISHAMVPVMNGCDNFCSYCIVPFVRGREISRNIDDIILEINNLEKNNISEITLLGQNVNSYSYISSDGIQFDFSGLLRKIISETGIRWIRFTSSNPQDFSEKLIDTVASEKRICPAIHLPAQHGSDKILSAMNRKYNSSDYISLALKLKNLDRKISLTSDLMVGFPGETEEDFILLKDLMNTVRFEEAFTYYYNPREGTAAYEFSDDVPFELKQSRLTEIINLQQKITMDEKKQRIGKEVTAVVEGPSKKDPNEILARTERNNMAVFPGTFESAGDYVKIKIADIKGNTYIAEV